MKLWMCKVSYVQQVSGELSLRGSQREEEKKDRRDKREKNARRSLFLQLMNMSECAMMVTLTQTHCQGIIATPRVNYLWLRMFSGI